MLIFPSNAAMVDDFERAAYKLAIELEQIAAASGEDGAVVVKALSWVLAGLALQASYDGHASLDEAVQLSTKTLIHCVARLADDSSMSGRVQ